MTSNEENLTPLGKWIKTALDERRKNQEWLAEQINVKPPQVSRIMRGKSEALPDLLDKIADHLGKPRVQIYRAAGHIEPATERNELDERILHSLNSLPIEERRRWAKRIELDVEFHEIAKRERTKSTNKTRA